MSKEAMKLALEALCDIIPANANIEEVRDKQSKASAALREALAKLAEQTDHQDMIGEAQDRLIAEQAAQAQPAPKENT